MIIFYVVLCVYFAGIAIHAFFRLIIEDRDKWKVKAETFYWVPLPITYTTVPILKYENTKVITAQLLNYAVPGQGKIMEFAKRDLLRQLGEDIMKGAEVVTMTEEEAWIQCKPWPYPPGAIEIKATIYVSNHKQNGYN